MKSEFRSARNPQSRGIPIIVTNTEPDRRKLSPIPPPFATLDEDETP